MKAVDVIGPRRGESRIRPQMQNEAIFTGDHKDRPYKEHAYHRWNEGLAT